MCCSCFQLTPTRLFEIMSVTSMIGSSQRTSCYGVLTLTDLARIGGKMATKGGRLHKADCISKQRGSWMSRQTKITKLRVGCIAKTRLHCALSVARTIQFHKTF